MTRVHEKAEGNSTNANQTTEKSQVRLPSGEKSEVGKE